MKNEIVISGGTIEGLYSDVVHGNKIEKGTLV